MSNVFRFQFTESWLTPAVMTALAGIDKGIYLGNNHFEVEHQGVISYTELSGGFRTLACIRNVDLSDWVDTDGTVYKNTQGAFMAHRMGANVFPFLGAVIDELDRDVNLEWSTSVYPERWGDSRIDAIVMDTGTHISTWKEFGDYVDADLMLLQHNTGEG
ncbi:MAG: hypothetical protein RSC68_00320 [Acinetobacter sp.]